MTPRRQQVEKVKEHDDSAGVTTLIEAMKHPLRSTIESIRKAILAADPDITEGIKWNSPSFYCHGWFATIASRKPSQIDVVLHCGAKAHAECTVAEAVEDPDQLLTWRSIDRALLSFRSESEFLEHRESFQRIVAQWAGYQKQKAVI